MFQLLTPVQFGDSLTDTHASRTVTAQAYPSLAGNVRNDRYSLDGRLWVDSLPNFNSSLDFAVAGQTTSDLSRQVNQYAALPRLKSNDLVFINMGTNDGGAGIPTARSLANIESAIAQVKSLGVQNIAIFGVQERFDINHFNDGLRSVAAKNNASFIDTSLFLKGLPNNGTWDGVHLSPEANQRLGLVANIVLQVRSLSTAVREKIARAFRSSHDRATTKGAIG